MKHKQTLHGGGKYLCDKCENRATTQRILMALEQAIHGDVSYLCDNCDYVAKTKGLLKMHKHDIHEGIGIHVIRRC